MEFTRTVALCSEAARESRRVNVTRCVKENRAALYKPKGILKANSFGPSNDSAKVSSQLEKLLSTPMTAQERGEGSTTTTKRLRRNVSTRAYSVGTQNDEEAVELNEEAMELNEDLMVGLGGSSALADLTNTASSRKRLNDDSLVSEEMKSALNKGTTKVSKERVESVEIKPLKRTRSSRRDKENVEDLDLSPWFDDDGHQVLILSYDIPLRLLFEIAVTFINRFWGNPLQHVVEGQVVIEPDTPEPLRNLQWNDMKYLCRVTTFSKIKKAPGGSVSFSHLDGTVSIYSPQQFLGRHDGVDSIVLDANEGNENAARIMTAWNWLIENNPLYDDFHHGDREVEYGEIIQDEEQIVAENFHGRNIFTTSVLHGLDAGPRAADFNLENVNIALEQREGVVGVIGAGAQGAEGPAEVNDSLTSFKDVNLLPKLFPELYPYGTNSFALWHHHRNVIAEDNVQDPGELEGTPGSECSVKKYTKYRLLHFDRRFAKNKRFITFMYDWITKNATFGYRMRSTTTTRGRDGQRTRQRDVLAR
ncbi:hypothetical protein BGZ65_007273, partial [Modicella reniformis]